MQALHPTNFRRRIASLMLVAYCASPILATAQVVINAGTPNDGRRAYVDQTQNGLPKVNIAAPNGAGVSRNTYSDFNVGKQGVILNNATNNSNTSLAGWVEGNPNLVPGKEAKLILNEVIGAKQSQLNGFIEVAGKKADVIVANENGITCNGCGFINTTRGTLSTGTAIWGSAGQLDGLKVRQGTITIGADGMSTPESRIDLLSQAINIQGAIHADQLNIVAGNNDIAYDTLKVNAATSSNLGSFDVSQLGGMYAKAACFNCHQTVSYSETWGGVIAAGATATVTATSIDNQTIDTRDGFAGLSGDSRVNPIDQRSGTQSPLTRAFVDRFGVVNGPSASAAGSAPSLKLGSPKTLSDGIVLTPSGKFDFSQYVLPNGKTGLFVVADPASPYLIKGRSDLYTPATNGQYTVYNKFAGSDYLLNATVQANQGDIKATALDINAGQNITLKAGGVVQLDAMQTNNSTVQDKQVLTGVSVDAETNTQTANYQNQTTRESSTQANGGTLKAGNDVTINGGQVSLSHTNAVAARDIKVEATDGGAALKAVDMQAERNFELSSAGNTAIVSDATEAANGSISQATSRIKAGNQANVTALNNLTVQGGDVQAKDINLIAMGDVTLTGVQNKQVYGGGSDTTTVAAQMGANAAANNRLLHKNEKQVISQMASGDSAKQDRLTDAACAMVKCSAQYAPSIQEYFDAKASEIRGANNTQELVELAKVNQATGLFGYSGIDNANDRFKFTANVVNKEIVQPIKDAKLPDGSYGVGYYQGLGGEVEVEVQNGSVVAGKVGLGVGAGGHINLGTQAVSGALMQGAVLGGKGEALVETNPIQSGEARVGASVGGALGIGAAGIEIGYGAGASGTKQAKASHK